MSNGKFALAVKQAAKEEGIQVKIKKHKAKKNKSWDVISPRIDMIQNTAVRFITIFFAIFVGFLEFFSCGFESGLRKALTMCEGGKKIKP